MTFGLFYGFKDFFKPQTNIWTTGTVAVISLALVMGKGCFTNSYYSVSDYYSVSLETFININKKEFICRGALRTNGMERVTIFPTT